MIDEFLCQSTSRCLKTAVKLANGGQTKTSHLLSGIVKNYESLASRTLWSLGAPEEIEQVSFQEDGDDGEFSDQVKGILRDSMAMVEGGTPLEIHKYAGFHRAVWPAHFVVSMLRSECAANKILSSLTIREDLFLDGLTVLHTTFLGTEFGTSEIHKPEPWGSSRPDALRDSVSYNTQLLRATVSFDEISALEREALRIYLESVTALTKYFDEQLGATAPSLEIHPASEVRPRHDPRNYLVNVISQLWELEECYTQIPKRARDLIGSVTFSAIRLHDHFTLAKKTKFGPP